MPLPESAKLSEAATSGLLALYASIVEELWSRGVVRSTNNPVGDYAEYLTGNAFDLTLVGNSAIGYDAVSGVGVRYQVKSRRLTARNPSRQLSFIRGFQTNTDPFDLLVGILFNSDFTVQRAALVPVEIVRARAVRVEYVNAWRFILRDAVWTAPRVEDVTDRIRAAAEASPLSAPRPAVLASSTLGRTARPPAPGAVPRALAPKADPLEVRAYFATTRLTRKELAAIVGTGIGVIATVQNPNGDRWSVERFERARTLIDAYLAAHPAPSKPTM